MSTVKLRSGCPDDHKATKSYLLSFSFLHCLWQILGFPLKSLLSIKAPSSFLKLLSCFTCRLKTAWYPMAVPSSTAASKTTGVLCTTRRAMPWIFSLLGIDKLGWQSSWLGFFDEYLLLQNDSSQKQGGLVGAHWFRTNFPSGAFCFVILWETEQACLVTKNNLGSCPGSTLVRFKGWTSLSHTWGIHYQLL